MKKSQLKFNVRRLTTCTAIVLAGMLASCSNDDVKNDPVQPEETTTETLKVISGASQKGRVQNFVETRASKSTKLKLVAEIAAPKERKDLNWSATAIDFNGAKAYVTWHSNKQAKNPAKEWGGAVDVIELNGNDELEISSTAVSKLLKFNHVLYADNKLFLGATSATDAGVVGRISLVNEGIAEDADIEIIGFPGVSVNAVAKYGKELIAVSGYKGTYGTFAPDAANQPYYDGDKDKRENVVTDLRPEADDFNNFGGKYVTTDEKEEVYVLHNTENATITKVETGKSVTLEGISLVSAVKVAETYDPITKEWIPSTDEHNYYGKHVLAVRNGKAYVGCGKNGLVVWDLANNKRP
ncbi:MAG: hypothetical protein K2M86_07350, partial [Odoribacter sp.]|nr:hypothetical protein [Odoribacter sp.]